MTTLRYYPLPRDVVALVRGADLLTGAFPTPLPAAAADKLRQLGLVNGDLSSLSERGRAVRIWLMLGAPVAPSVVAELLTPATYRLAA